MGSVGRGVTIEPFGSVVAKPPSPAALVSASSVASVIIIKHHLLSA